MDSLYADFLQSYPSSEFSTAARQQYEWLPVFLGAEYYFDAENAGRRGFGTRVLLSGTVVNGEVISQLSPPEASQLVTKTPYLNEPWASPDPSSILVIPTNAVDWIYSVVVDTLADPDSIVATGSTLLTEGGYASFEFGSLPMGQYMVAVDHRNHLAVVSDTLVDFTSGYAFHDFTTGHALGNSTGTKPQKVIVAGSDTVHAMWTADGGRDVSSTSKDGQITAADFNAWLSDTKSAATGYVDSDYNLDGQVTVGDFNSWLANTKQALAAPGLVTSLLYNRLPSAAYTGESSTAAAKTTTTPASHSMRYYITGLADFEPKGYAWVALFANTASPSEVDTLGSATFDVYFNDEQVYYWIPQGYQDLLDAGYDLEINQGLNEHGAFMRVDIYTWHPDTVGYEIEKDWQYGNKLLRLGFKETDGAITEHGIAANRASLDLHLLSDGIYTEPDSVAIEFEDLFAY